MLIKRKVVFKEEDVKGGDFNDTAFKNCKFISLGFRFVNFHNCTFENCDFSESLFDSVGFSDCFFPESKLSFLDFSNTSIQNCSFANSLAENCIFQKLKAGSKSEAKRLILGSAVDINGEVVNNPNQQVSIGDKIKVGKKIFLQVN